MKETYAVMIPVFVTADSPKEALKQAIEDIYDYGVKVQPTIVDGYVTTHDYTVEHMEYAGFEYVEVP